MDAQHVEVVPDVCSEALQLHCELKKTSNGRVESERRERRPLLQQRYWKRPGRPERDQQRVLMEINGLIERAENNSDESELKRQNDK